MFHRQNALSERMQCWWRRLRDTADTSLCLLHFLVPLTLHIVSADASHQPVFHYLLYAEIFQTFDSEFPPVIYILIFICLLELMASKNHQNIPPPLLLATTFTLSLVNGTDSLVLLSQKFGYHLRDLLIVTSQG